MKLEMKFLAPYLPYGLRIQRGQRNLKMNMGKGSSTHWIGISAVIDWFNSDMISKPMPILRPMSDLFMTDEDISCDLMDIVMGCDQYCDAYGEWYESYINNPETIRLLQAPYEVFEELVKQMYDVYDLIGQGLAISIHDLEK